MSVVISQVLHVKEYSYVFGNIIEGVGIRQGSLLGLLLYFFHLFNPSPKQHTLYKILEEMQVLPPRSQAAFFFTWTLSKFDPSVLTSRPLSARKEPFL